MNLHNLKQTKENKGIVNSYLLSILQNRKHTKEELIGLLHKDERSIRNDIQKISMFFPVISYSNSKGYRVVNTEEVVKRNSPLEISYEIEEIDHTLNEIKSRIKMLKKKEHALIASKRVLEKYENR